MEPETCEIRLEAGHRRIAAFNGESPYALSMAIGHVEIRGNEILEAVTEADRRMYADKARWKQSHGEAFCSGHP